jgi:hypothetical protein
VAEDLSHVGDEAQELYPVGQSLPRDVSFEARQEVLTAGKRVTRDLDAYGETLMLEAPHGVDQDLVTLPRVEATDRDDHGKVSVLLSGENLHLLDAVVDEMNRAEAGSPALFGDLG